MIFFFLLIINLYSANFFYNSTIRISVQTNPSEIQKDLSIIEDYRKKFYSQEKKYSPTIITASENDKNSNGFEMYNKRKDPYQEIHYEIAKKLLETRTNGIEGINIYYRGYATQTNNMGIAILPRIDANPIISIVITEKIDPVIVNGKIPDHFIIDLYSKYQAYNLQNIEKSSSSIMKWKIEVNKNIIQNRKIPYDSIIILGDPDYLFFDKEYYIMDKSTNIIIPDLFLLNEKNNNLYSELAMQTLQYYKKLEKSYYTTEIEKQIHEGIILK